jgi:hypothetical protein
VNSVAPKPPSPSALGAWTRTPPSGGVFRRWPGRGRGAHAENGGPRPRYLLEPSRLLPARPRVFLPPSRRAGRHTPIFGANEVGRASRDVGRGTGSETSMYGSGRRVVATDGRREPAKPCPGCDVTAPGRASGAAARRRPGGVRLACGLDGPARSGGAMSRQRRGGMPRSDRVRVGEAAGRPSSGPPQLRVVVRERLHQAGWLVSIRPASLRRRPLGCGSAAGSPRS